MEIKIPMVASAFWPIAAIPQIKEKLFGIKSQYGTTINQAAALMGVSAELITSVIFIESAGNAKAVSRAGAVGLMQITPETASGVIFLTKKSAPLSPDLRQSLTTYIGVQRLSCIESQHYMDEKKSCAYAIGVKELMSPSLNILIGSMLLALLVAQHTENGIIRLDKVITRYNRGYFYKPKGTITELMANAPAETKAYILKLVGINSTLDILTA